MSADKSPKAFLVTGAAGFLGSHLSEALLARGARVVGVDNLIGGYRDNVAVGVEFHELDCIDRDALAELMHDIDVVYHCASTAYEGLSVFSPHLVTQNTYGITLSTLSAAIVGGVTRFVFCSSMARYGTQATQPFTENMTPAPQDPYGIAKYAAELSVRELCETHGLEYVVAVPHNIIGPRQKYDDPYRNVAAIMINLMLQGRQPIIYGDGEQKRSFSFVGDVVHPLVEMGVRPGLSGEVINIGPDEVATTINELAETIGRLLDIKVQPQYLPDRPREVKVATCSAEKARRLLGYRTTTMLEDGLADMIAYIRARGPKPFTYHLPIEIVSDKTPRSWKEKLF
ncbi:MAG: NAD-dependent epimerase/dehydratase family protein [Minisyncoccia bacterium]